MDLFYSCQVSVMQMAISGEVAGDICILIQPQYEFDIFDDDDDNDDDDEDDHDGGGGGSVAGVASVVVDGIGRSIGSKTTNPVS